MTYVETEELSSNSITLVIEKKPIFYEICAACGRLRTQHKYSRGFCEYKNKNPVYYISLHEDAVKEIQYEKGNILYFFNKHFYYFWVPVSLPGSRQRISVLH